MRIPFASRGEIINTWQILVTNNTLNVALLIGLVFFILLLAVGTDSTAYVLLPIMYGAGGALLLIPIAAVLAISWRTRPIAGLLIYLPASLWLIWLWLFSFMSLYQNTEIGWPLAGVALSCVSSGLGMFAVYALVGVLKGQWLAVLIMVGSVFLCRIGSNLGKKLMGMKPSQKLSRWVMEYDPILLYDQEPLPTSSQSPDDSQPGT